MKVLINTEEQTITFIEGEWDEIISYLKMNPDFTLIDERGLIQPIEELEWVPNYPIYPTYPLFPTFLTGTITGSKQ